MASGDAGGAADDGGLAVYERLGQSRGMVGGGFRDLMFLGSPAGGSGFRGGLEYVFCSYYPGMETAARRTGTS